MWYYGTVKHFDKWNIRGECYKIKYDDGYEDNYALDKVLLDPTYHDPMRFEFASRLSSSCSWATVSSGTERLRLTSNALALSPPLAMRLTAEMTVGDGGGGGEEGSPGNDNGRAERALAMGLNRSTAVRKLSIQALFARQKALRLERDAHQMGCPLHENDDQAREAAAGCPHCAELPDLRWYAPKPSLPPHPLALIARPAQTRAQRSHGGGWRICGA